MKCPKCSFDCFAPAKRCVCGYEFTTFGVPPASGPHANPGRTPPIPPLPPTMQRHSGGGGRSGVGVGAGGMQIVVGLIFLVGGIAVTALTYKSAVASGGGRYIVAHGPVMFGAVQLLRGIGESLKR